jgi:hypothetical protein
MFGNMQNAYDDIFAADRFDGARAGEVGGRRNEVAPANEPGPELLIHMDYRRPAFALGGLEIFDRSSETPQVIQEPYKAPPAPKDGFIRSFAEDDIVLCPRCGDELATGNDDTKSQVWVVKQCGHVSRAILPYPTADADLGHRCTAENVRQIDLPSKELGGKPTSSHLRCSKSAWWMIAIAN